MSLDMVKLTGLPNYTILKTHNVDMNQKRSLLCHGFQAFDQNVKKTYDLQNDSHHLLLLLRATI